MMSCPWSLVSQLRGQAGREHQTTWLYPQIQESPVGAHRGVLQVLTFLGWWLSIKSTAYSSGMGDILNSLLTGPSRDASSISSLSRCIRGATHLWRSWAALQRTRGSVPNLSAQHCRAQASTKVSSFLFSWKSLVPGGSMQGKKSQ